MSLNWKNKQAFAIRILTAHLEQDRLSHAYLFTGDENSGKEEVAKAFAQSLLCESKIVFGACDCNACRKIKEESHPDLHYLGADLKAKSIKIEEVRNNIHLASLKPFEAKWKVFLVPEADRLTTDASNAFLKTLEEPPEHSIFVLMTENRSNMLETIQSRCFELRFRPGGQRMDVQPWDLKKSRSWISLLDALSDKTRHEVLSHLDDLAYTLRLQMEENASAGTVKALDKIFETKDALDHNVNQKLAITRLEALLEKYVPLGI